MPKIGNSRSGSISHHYALSESGSSQLNEPVRFEGARVLVGIPLKSKPLRALAHATSTHAAQVGRRGFCLLKADGARGYASCRHVLEELHRCPAAAEALKMHADAITEVSAKLQAEELLEGDGAKTILMLLGPQVSQRCSPPPSGRPRATTLTLVPPGGAGDCLRGRVPQRRTCSSSTPGAR